MDDSLIKELKAITVSSHVERYTMAQGILKTDRDFLGVMFKGIGPEYDMSFLSESLVEGELPALRTPQGGQQRQPLRMVISQTMAES